MILLSALLVTGLAQNQASSSFSSGSSVGTLGTEHTIATGLTMYENWSWSVDLKLPMDNIPTSTWKSVFFIQVEGTDGLSQVGARLPSMFIDPLSSTHVRTAIHYTHQPNGQYSRYENGENDFFSTNDWVNVAASQTNGLIEFRYNGNVVHTDINPNPVTFENVVIIMGRQLGSFGIATGEYRNFQFYSSPMNSSPPNQSTGCAPSWSPHTVDGVVKCYKSFGLHQLGQATSVCASSQASLLSPNNANEYNDLKNVVGLFGFETAALDGNDVQTEDTWVKSDGSPVPFFQWLTVPHPEPNNAGGNEDCLQIHVWEGSQDMNDRPCTFEDNTICEKPSVVCLNDAWEVDENGNCQPKPTHFRLECSASGMVLQIDDVVFPDGEDITLEDSTCTGTKTGNIWSINTSLDSCQTSMVVETDSNGVETLAFSNTVKFNSFSAGAQIYTGNLVYIDFTCNYGSTYDDIEVGDVNLISENVDADSQDVDGSFNFGLVQYTDSAMSDAADAGHTTPLGGTMYFQLTMDNPVSSLDWVITECVVVDDTLNLSYALINGQCPDTNLQVQTTNVGTPKTAINLSYTGFKFTQSVDNQQAAMKIRCSVTVCDASAATSTCNFDPATC